MTPDVAAAILQSIDAAVIAMDGDGTIRFWSRGAERLYGYTSVEMEGRTVDLLTPPGERERTANARAQAIAGESIAPQHVRRIRKDGLVIETVLIVAPILDASGAAVGVSELTHQVSTPSSLDEAAYRLAAIVDSSDDVIVSKDLNGIVITWNGAAERMFGFSAAEMVGQSITKIIPTERLGEEDFVLSRIRAGRLVDHFETQRRRKDGTLVDVSLTVSPVRTPDGRIIGASKIARDITERKRLGEMQRIVAEKEERERLETLEAENRRIHEASRVKNEFVANMSHELRTPLHAIIGFTEVWVDQRLGPVSDEYRELGNIVLASSNHLLQLINDILDLAKIESGTIEFHPEPIDLPTLVDEVQAVIKGLATKNGIVVETDLHPGVSGLSLDPAKLKQVFYNYLSNAIKFTPDGGRVLVRVLPEGDEAFRIEVEDTGIGVPPGAQHRLFVEFQQLDPGTTKRYRGTGLGLALTKRIVEAQGGSVGFRSTPGEGSTFYATLPRIVLPLSAGITSGVADNAE